VYVQILHTLPRLSVNHVISKGFYASTLPSIHIRMHPCYTNNIIDVLWTLGMNTFNIFTMYDNLR